MPPKVPSGRGNRQQRDVRAKGVRGNKRSLKQNRPVVGDVRKKVSPSTWNTAGSSSVYFRQLKWLPGALSDRRLLCCLTRKEKRERNMEAGGLTCRLSPRLVCFLQGMKDFQKQRRDRALRGERDGDEDLVFYRILFTAMLLRVILAFQCLPFLPINFQSLPFWYDKVNCMCAYVWVNVRICGWSERLRQENPGHCAQVTP